MIELTRLNGSPLILNCDLIKTCEASPDTMITLLNGEKLIVRDGLKQVVQRVLAYRARLLATAAEQLPRMTTATAIDNCAALEACVQAEKASLDSARGER